jgi:hypothetical protein
MFFCILFFFWRNNFFCLCILNKGRAGGLFFVLAVD